MARRPKPWWWSQVGEWAVTIDGQRHRLGPDKDVAETKFHQLMSKPTVTADSVANIIDLFLDWTGKHRAIETFLWYKKHLQSFLDVLRPKTMTADRLRPHHVEAWVDVHHWGDSYTRGAMTAVARCFNWAEKKGHIDRNPIRGKLEKPAAGKRDRVLSPAEFKELLRHVSDEFRDLLVISWETGCRPQESTKVEARHVDLPNGRWVFPVKESKGKREQRIVYLSKKALAITKRLMKEYPKGTLLRRPNGEPWGRHDISQHFGRLKKHVGVHYRLYDLRHSFVTNGLKNGVDPITMQHLVGHSDLTMISKIYAKVQQDVGHMRRAAAKAVQ